MAFLQAVHVLANLVWIGSVLSTGLVLTHGAGDAKTRGETALLLYRKLATPAFVLSFLLGSVVLFNNPAYYFKTTHFMHAKLPLALGVIGIHHVIGARAKKLSAGTTTELGPTLVLTLVLGLLAAGAALIVMLKPF
jgi:protoporphyrinogen IX oxidase